MKAIPVGQQLLDESERQAAALVRGPDLLDRVAPRSQARHEANLGDRGARPAALVFGNQTRVDPASDRLGRDARLSRYVAESLLGHRELAPKMVAAGTSW